MTLITNNSWEKKSKLVINILKPHVTSAQILAVPSEMTTAMKRVIQCFQKTLKIVKKRCIE